MLPRSFFWLGEIVFCTGLVYQGPPHMYPSQYLSTNLAVAGALRNKVAGRHRSLELLDLLDKALEVPVFPLCFSSSLLVFFVISPWS